ncbi:MAG: type I-E CRISPR-associated protein Cse1/CasA [Candidatus Desantisbacteria bacterium]
MPNRFNLVDEPWIPVAGKGLVSLADVFSNPNLSALGGNPIQKIALTKLLLAIAQTAYIPEDDEDWKNLGAFGMAERALAYLTEKKELFWLYGEKPFLQMPAIAQAEKQSFGAVQVYIATGNTTVLTQGQVETSLTDAEKAILVVQMMGFGLGGKKADNSIILSSDYQGKSNDKGNPSTGKPGPSIGFRGFLHSFLQGKYLMETLWINLLTEENMKGLKYFSNGFGTAPWEEMPQGEDCPAAKSLKNSHMGRLVPISRFVLLTDNGLHYSEGIVHPGYAEGMADPSVAVDYSGAKAKVLWVDPEKRPWRQLPALLSFLESEKNKGDFDCLQLRLGVPRVKKANLEFGLWSGGLRVSSNAGEQYVSGSNDFVESEIQLDSSSLGDLWFSKLKGEMDELDKLSKITYGATMAFFNAQKGEGKDQAAQASNLFWQLCERRFQKLVDACNDNTGEEVKELRRTFAGFVNKAYNTYCPKDTARQMDAWAANLPNLSKYLQYMQANN